MKHVWLKALIVGALAIGVAGCNTDEETCDNGVLDGSETGVDCGGDCDDCQPFTLFIDGVSTQAYVTASFNHDFSLGSMTGSSMGINFLATGNVIVALAYSNDDINSTSVHEGTYATTTSDAMALVPFGHGHVSWIDMNPGGQVYMTDVVSLSQTITLTDVDPVNHTITGSFDVSLGSGSSQVVAMTVSGSFNNLTYTE